MENKVKKAVDNFVGNSDELPQEESYVTKQLIEKDKSLVERVNRVYVTSDGRQLLSE